jgi:hypothetical protein
VAKEFSSLLESVIVTDLQAAEAYSSLDLTKQNTASAGNDNNNNNNVTDLINALPGNSSVNTNRGNNRRETVFPMRSVPSKSTKI